MKLEKRKLKNPVREGFCPQGLRSRTGRPCLRSAFTLIEILVAMAIIAIIVAVMFPIVASVRENANRTVAISNMRQCMVAFLQYENENGDTLADLPSHPVAQALVGRNLLWDPQDNLRTNPSQPVGDSTMIGSFGYLGGGISCTHCLIAMDHNPPVLVDYFHPVGTVSTLFNIPVNYRNIITPVKCLFARYDSSAKVESCRNPCDSDTIDEYPMFGSASNLFMDRLMADDLALGFNSCPKN